VALARGNCPYYEKITMGMHYYGIMCNTSGEPKGYSNEVCGPGWLKLFRDAWIKQYCGGRYEYCRYYKAAQEAEAKAATRAEKRKQKKTGATASKRKT